MKQVIIKNLIILVLLVPFYFLTLNEVETIPTDKLETLLLFVGLIVIAPVTSNFIFSYTGDALIFTFHSEHIYFSGFQRY